MAAEQPALTLWGGSGNRSSRCLWMLEELGVPYTSVPIDSRDGSTHKPEYLAMNPHAKVPTLRDTSVEPALILNESAAINNYLCDRYGSAEAQLIPPPATPERAHHDAACFTIMSELDVSLYTHRKHGMLPEEYGEAPAAVAAAEKYFGERLAAFTTMYLGGGSHFLLGDSFSAVDCLAGHTLIWALLVGWCAASREPEHPRSRSHAQPCVHAHAWPLVNSSLTVLLWPQVPDGERAAVCVYAAHHWAACVQKGLRE